DQLEDLDLPRTERLSPAAHPVHQTGGDSRGQCGPAAGSGPDRGGQLLRRGVLEEVPGRARLHRGEDVDVRLVGGEDENSRTPGTCGDGGSRLRAVHAPAELEV